ncbi:hypothetical protein [Blastopirellula marina]|nr:hypothetical protein [Blastopirellula marina]
MSVKITGLNLQPILSEVLREYQMSLRGIHGVAHWARVLENGLYLAAETGADVAIVSLFAVLHDSQRVDDGYDPGHGQRAADFARKMRPKHIDISDDNFELLYEACAGHTHELTHENITVQTCWDADRLDLGRVGVTPHPSRLCTDFAKRAETIHWAFGRSALGVTPEWVKEEWEIDLQPQ